MMANADHYTGLPFVPKPATDELLGSWLLRVAQQYGLGLPTLLKRVGAWPAGTLRLPHWFTLNDTSVCFDALSAATCLSTEALAELAPSTCRPHWPTELGACAKCFSEAADAGGPITWKLSWMHPLATVCNIHGTWLTPVTTRALARIRHAEDFHQVARHVTEVQALLDDGPRRDEDALWLQQLCTTRTNVHLPWGEISPSAFIPLLGAISHEVHQISMPNDSLQADPILKDVKFRSADDWREMCLSLPVRLRSRQSTLSKVAHVLQWPAHERRPDIFSWSPASPSRLTSWYAWPEGALAWVCPIAAELVRRKGELRSEFCISRQYYQAYNALLESMGCTDR
jgi:hypothetical protein